MAIERELLDRLLAGRDPQDLFAEDGLADEPEKALSERSCLKSRPAPVRYGSRCPAPH
jgi:hypothetical protein